MELRNQNGKIVGIDSDGNVVPVEFGSVSTDVINHTEVWADPSDNVPGIRDAINSVSGPVHVKLRVGTYEVENDDPHTNPPLPITKDHVKITGQGWGTELYLPDSSTPTDKGCRFIHVGGDDASNYEGTNAYEGFILKDLAINGNWQGNDDNGISGTYDGHNIQIQGTNCIVQNVKSYNATGDGVEPISFGTDADGEPITKNIIISNNFFLNNYEQAIHVHGAKDVIVTDNVCIGEQTGGLAHIFSHESSVKNVRFENNIFRDSVVNDRAIIHLDIQETTQSAESIHFVDNIVKDCPNNTAIRSHGGRNNNVYIKGNELKNNKKGITLIGADRTWVENNNIEAHDDMGIDVQATVDTSYLYIRDNTIYNNNRGDTNSEAINFRFDGSTHDNIFVERNDLVSDSAPLHQYAVFFNESAAGTYEDIFVRDNYIEGVNIANSIDGIDAALTVDNVGNDDSRSSLPPVTAVEGLKYLDDGTNRTDSSYGYREYIAGSWRDL